MIDVSLRPFEEADLSTYETWRAEIKAQRFMSNFFPDCFSGGQTRFPGKCLWSVIRVDGRDVGVIWLKRAEEDNSLARLGIVIGRTKLWGRGIGRRAIKAALGQGIEQWGLERVVLRVRKNNARALACYRATGFEIALEGHKVNRQGEAFEFFEMNLDLNC